MRNAIPQLFLLLVAACAPQQQPAQKSISMHERENAAIYQAVDQTGTVGYWEEIGHYTINFSRPGTIDSYVTLIVDEMPPAFQQEDLTVVFTGSYQANPDLPRPMIGGQEIYQLTLEKIELKAE